MLTSCRKVDECKPLDKGVTTKVEVDEISHYAYLEWLLDDVLPTLSTHDLGAGSLSGLGRW